MCHSIAKGEGFSPWISHSWVTTDITHNAWPQLHGGLKKWKSRCDCVRGGGQSLSNRPKKNSSLPLVVCLRDNVYLRLVNKCRDSSMIVVHAVQEVIDSSSCEPACPSFAPQLPVLFVCDKTVVIVAFSSERNHFTVQRECDCIRNTLCDQSEASQSLMKIFKK